MHLPFPAVAIFLRPIRTALVLVVLVSLVGLTPPSAYAQSDDTRPQSYTKGLYVQGMLSGGTLAFDDFDGTDPGFSFSGRLGYGITNTFGLFAEFDAGAFNAESEFTEVVHTPEYVVGAFNVGGQVNFRSGKKWVPYGELALTGLVTGDELSNTFSAAGLTVGGGVKYYLTDSWALDGRLHLSPVEISSLDYDGQDLEGVDVNAISTRLSIGVTWFVTR